MPELQTNAVETIPSQGSPPTPTSQHHTSTTMPTYSLFPSSSQPPTTSTSTSTTHSPESVIPCRSTGAAGKHIFSQPPSWSCKPLPSPPLKEASIEKAEKADNSEDKGDGDDASSMITEVGGERETEGRVRKVVRGLREVLFGGGLKG